MAPVRPQSWYSARRTRAATSVLPGVQVNETSPVNRPSPVMVTGKVPMAPLATLALPAVTEKSQAVPFSVKDCGLPLALSVNMMVPLSAPGALVALGLNVMLSMQGVPPGDAAMVMGRAPQEFESDGVVGAGGDRCDRERRRGARVADRHLFVRR